MSKNSKAFEEHLKICQQCRENPYGLCSIGNILQAQAIEEDEEDEYRPQRLF